MEKTYQPQQIEQALYQHWEAAGYFQPTGKGPAFSIVIPPPNVTGSLHMGHGFQQTMMDVLTRYHRMCGDNTLWQPGTDHAGISTQMVVEQQLMAEGSSRQSLGREAFEQKVWDWKAKSGSTIVQQSRRLGISPDWSRERFTLDAPLNKAVNKVFIDLFREGLIYRGKKLVNWDPKLRTAISDLEVVNTPRQGSLWYIRYPVVGSQASLVIATTRPETLLADAAIAVHPEDPRYQHLIGHEVRVPLCDRLIPIIADDYVDPEFGTGCVKITPAHDFNDYEVGKRHHLPLMNILTADAHLNDNVPEAYRGLERFTARKKIIADLDAAGLLANTEKHEHVVPYGDKSGVVIEPWLTDQWYMKMKPLAAPALTAVLEGRVTFTPENWVKTYQQWLENIEDWCISRQLWWGHRIPVWYDEHHESYVGESEAAVRAHYQLPATVKLTQDPDVLDTWFSSALWPFSTLGWPEKDPAFTTFFPTSVLVTGFDIIFFWVARMMMLSLKLTGEVPFKAVYIHGLIRDEEGQKMSKSKGNVLDPIDLIDGITLPDLIQKRTTGMMQPQLAEAIKKRTRKQFPNGITSHGTDALRFTFCAMANNGRDINFDLQRLGGYRNFCNKLWNAARFVLMQTAGQLIEKTPMETLPDMWITVQLEKTIAKVHHDIAQYRFDYLAQTLYEFTWHTFCDWYLELTKITLHQETNDNAVKAGIRYHLLSTLETLLRLLHPIMPFITETIWQSLKAPLQLTGDTLMLQAYPTETVETKKTAAEPVIDWLKAMTLAIRNVRGEMNIAPNKQLQVYLAGGSEQDAIYFAQTESLLKPLAQLDQIVFKKPPANEKTAMQVVDGLEVHISLAGLMDPAAEATRLAKEIEKLSQNIARLENKLNNPSFLAKAPVDVVEKEQEKLNSEKLALSKLRQAQQPPQG